MPADRPMLFALSETRALGERVAVALGLELSSHEEREFEDGEHKARPLVSVRGRDAYVIQSLHGDEDRSVNDKLCRMLFFCATLVDASAASVSVVLPYLCYARKDRRTKSRDPVTARYVAQLVEAAGVTRVLVLDVHNPAALQNGFRILAEHLEARPLLVREALARLGDAPATVVTPDAGGALRANAFRTALSAVRGAPAASAFAEKARSGGHVTGDLLVGDLEGRVAIIVDDLISTGTTMVRTARRCRELGAEGVLAMATHGVFSAGADAALADPALDAVVVTDSVGPLRPLGPAVREKLTVLEVAPLLADALDRVHRGGSLVDLESDWAAAAAEVAS